MIGKHGRTDAAPVVTKHTCGPHYTTPHHTWLTMRTGVSATAEDNIDNLEQRLEVSEIDDNINYYNDDLQEAQQEFTETALYSTEMVKCTIQATTAVLEKNQEIMEMNLNKNRCCEKSLKLNGRINSEEKIIIDKSNGINENIEDEMSREIFTRLNTRLFQSLNQQRLGYSE